MVFFLKTSNKYFISILLCQNYRQSTFLIAEHVISGKVNMKFSRTQRKEKKLEVILGAKSLFSM